MENLLELMFDYLEDFKTKEKLVKGSEAVLEGSGQSYQISLVRLQL